MFRCISSVSEAHSTESSKHLWKWVVQISATAPPPRPPCSLTAALDSTRFVPVRKNPLRSLSLLPVHRPGCVGSLPLQLAAGKESPTLSQGQVEGGDRGQGGAPPSDTRTHSSGAMNRERAKVREVCVMGPGLQPLGQGPDLAVELMQLALRCVGSSGLSGSILFTVFTTLSARRQHPRGNSFSRAGILGDLPHWNSSVCYGVCISC